MELEVTRIKQKEAILYLGWLRAEELINRSNVDVWRESHREGYQRELVPKRVAEVAWYLKGPEGLLPTAVLISVRDDITFREEQPLDGSVRGQLEVPDEEILWVIDGQHRVAGLAKAIENGAQELRDYPVPVVIMANPNKFDEMRAFYLVNSRAKSVPTDLAERILQRVMAERGPDWIKKYEAESYTKSTKAINQARAVEVVDYLRRECSAWKDMVAVPGEPKPHPYAIKQHTLITAILEGPFKNTTINGRSPEAIGKLLSTYWEAVAELWPEAIAEPKLYSLRKTVGVFSLNMIFPDIFDRCREVRDYTQPKMLEILRHLGIDSDFWHGDRKRGDPRTFGAGMKVLKFLTDDLREALPPLTLAGL